MGIIRGSLVFVISFLLVLSLLLMNSTLVISSSLKYENVQNQIDPLVSELSSGSLNQFLPQNFNTGEVQGLNLTSEMDKAKDLLEENCVGKENYFFESEQFNVTIPCSLVNETPETFVSKSVGNLLEQNYYQSYDCKFFDCMDKTGTPFSMISENAQNYWKTKFYYLVVISLILILFLFLALEDRVNLPIVLGPLLILSALPFFKLQSFLTKFLDDIVVLVLKIFLGQSTKVFWIMFVLGIVLLVGGIAFKVYSKKKGVVSEKKAKK